MFAFALPVFGLLLWSVMVPSFEARAADLEAEVRAALTAIDQVSRSTGDPASDAEIEEADRTIRLEMARQASKFEGREAEVVTLLGEFLRDPTRSKFGACGAAPFLGVVGRRVPERAIRELVRSLPQQEQVHDLCIGNGIAQLGPPGYPEAYRAAMESRDTVVLSIVAIALVGQTVESEFPVTAGLGEGFDWPHFPERRRGLRALLRKWDAWWRQNADRFAWDPATLRLKSSG